MHCVSFVKIQVCSIKAVPIPGRAGLILFLLVLEFPTNTGASLVLYPPQLQGLPSNLISHPTNPAACLNKGLEYNTAFMQARLLVVKKGKAFTVLKNCAIKMYEGVTVKRYGF
jgi:hypothetical protein